jgi:hypothetical protein
MVTQGLVRMGMNEEYEYHYGRFMATYKHLAKRMRTKEDGQLHSHNKGKWTKAARNKAGMNKCASNNGAVLPTKNEGPKEKNEGLEIENWLLGRVEGWNY